MDAAEVVEHVPLDWLYQQGAFCQNLFLVQTGLVKLTQVMPEGDEVLIRLLGPGEVFGYFSLVLRFPSITSAQTVRRSQLLVWERKRAIDLMHSNPRFIFNLFKHAVQEVVYFQDRASHLQTQPVGRRVEWAVAKVAQTIGTKYGEGITIGDGIGQREIADLAGTTIFTVSRELTRLQREGVLRKERRQIVILQVERLYR